LREKLHCWKFFPVNAGFVTLKAINFSVNIYGELTPEFKYLHPDVTGEAIKIEVN